MKPLFNPECRGPNAFGCMPDGRQVDSWTLQGSGGLSLEVLTYGGIVRDIRFPQPDGESISVVLGYPDLADYLNDPFYLGATVGRIAGRITNGHLRVGNEFFHLPLNEPPHHLHGGPQACHNQIWSVKRVDQTPSLCLHWTSCDGDQGYPGAVDIQVTYTVLPDNTFEYSTRVTSDRPTPVSLTHHGYFNLGGGENIRGHELQVFSDTIIPTDEALQPIHQRRALNGDPADLRCPRPLGEIVPHLPRQHGELYWLGESGGTIRPVARVVNPKSALELSVATTQTCLQTYFGSSFDGSQRDQNGSPIPPFGALCLECQGYPMACNREGFGDLFVRPGAPQNHRTHYTFSRIDT